MSFFLAVDGGGSKLEAILFDEKLNLLGYGRGSGINSNVVSRQSIDESIESTLDQLFDQRICPVLDCVYLTFIGDKSPFLRALEKRTHVREHVILTELQAGLMAGALWKTGIIAIAGTGSNFILETGNQQFHPLNGGLPKVGGWGAILGDDGSGAWMGHQAAQKAIAAYEGWDEASCLMEEIISLMHFHSPYDLKKHIYSSPAPYRELARLTYAIATAADKGDQVAIEILREAGNRLAKQAICLLNRCGPLPSTLYRIVCAGGAWKVHPTIFETFFQTLHAFAPELPIQTPLFEPVCAGCLIQAMNQGLTPQAAVQQLKEQMPQFIIHW